MKKLLLIATLFLVCIPVFALKRYYVNNAINTGWKYNLAGVTSWATSSNGVATASEPTTSDTVYCDGSSPSGQIDSSYTISAWDCTGYTGTLTHNSGITITLSGSYCKFVSAMTYTLGSATTSALIFTGTNSWTGAAKTFGNVTLNGSGVTQTLQDSVTLGATATYTLTQGTVNLNGKILSAGILGSSNSNTRNITSASGSITVTGSGTVISASTMTNFTLTGTLTITSSYSGASSRTFTQGDGGLPATPMTNLMSVNVTAGSGTVTVGVGGNILNWNLTGFTGSFAGNNMSIYGSLTTTNSMTVSNPLGTVFTMKATSGTQTITTGGYVIMQGFDFNGVGGTWQLQDALDDSLGAVTLTKGTLDLNGKTLTAATFGGSGASAKNITSGSGGITLTGTGTVWNHATATLYTQTGALTVTINTNTASARTISHGNTVAPASPEANSPSFSITAGTGPITTSTGGNIVGLDFTGQTGAWANNTQTIYGSLTLSATMGISGGGAALTFAATSGTKTITSNGNPNALDRALTFNGVGGTWQLADALNDSVRAITLTNGTLNLNGKAVTAGSFVTATGTKTLTIGASTLTLNQAGTIFNNAQNANFTVTANTGTVKFTDATSSTKTFAGGGANYNGMNLYFTGAGTGAFILSGSNTFADLKCDTPPHTVTFTDGTTTTITSLTVAGTAGNLMTLGGTSTAGWTISDNAGTNSVTYTSISYSTATGGATFSARGAGNVNGGHNSGWLFPATGRGFTMIRIGLRRIPL